jgi:hypothetical protein
MLPATSSRTGSAPSRTSGTAYWAGSCSTWTSDPDHLVFSLVTPDGALGIRYRIAYSDPSRIEQEARTIDGRPTWITLPVYPPTPNGGPPQPTGDPVKDAQIAASWATYNQTLGMSWLLAAGADLRITV